MNDYEKYNLLIQTLEEQRHQLERTIDYLTVLRNNDEPFMDEDARLLQNLRYPAFEQGVK